MCVCGRSIINETVRGTDQSHSCAYSVKFFLYLLFTRAMKRAISDFSIESFVGTQKGFIVASVAAAVGGGTGFVAMVSW